MIISAYGDSNTYGYDPRSAFGGRYPKNVRWTGIIDSQQELSVINHGVNGASIPKSDAAIRSYFDSANAEGAELITLMLGSNDLLEMTESTVSAADVGGRMAHFLSISLSAAPSLPGKLLLIAPPVMKPGEWTTERIVKESCCFGRVYKDIAANAGVSFIDTSDWGIELCFDGVHFSEKGHMTFAKRLWELIY